MSTEPAASTARPRLHIGLTGGIASGKSTVAAELARRGAVVVDADALARAVVAPGSAGLAQVREAFGEEAIGPDGAMDRAAVARLVFADAAARERLNGIIHPLVRAEGRRLVAEAGPEAVVVQDSQQERNGSSHLAIEEKSRNTYVVMLTRETLVHSWIVQY